MSCQQVPTAPAFNPYPRSVQVGEFEVAIGGGIWVAIGERKPNCLIFVRHQPEHWKERRYFQRGKVACRPVPG